MMNPMARNYQGYVQANQAVLEEEEEEDDVEAGTRTPSRNPQRGWRGDASEMNVLRPNVQEQDKPRDQDSSDDEVPQSFMIEATATAPPRRKSTSKGKSKDMYKQPLGNKGRHAPPILPTSSSDAAANISIPPKPSEVDPPLSYDDNAPTYTQPKQMRGLDAYERALWNWVNVYNLDAFLQEVYYYYEGKGIYCIALSRGLNLLLVLTALMRD